MLHYASMKSQLSFILFLLLLSAADAQSGSMLNMGNKSISIALRAKGPEKDRRSLFQSIEVIDARPDTSLIGIHTENRMLPQTRLRQLVLSGPVAASVRDWLGALFAGPGAEYKVLVVIRKLWVSDVSYSYREREAQEDPEFRDNKINIRLKAEIYASKEDGRYTPVLRYDTVLVMAKFGYNKIGESLSDLLQQLGDTLSSPDIDRKWSRNRLIGRGDIDRFNHSSFDYPIFRDSTLIKGVYASYSEFLNNSPSLHNYELVKEKNNSLLYTRDDAGHSYYNHNAWGICDGKGLYVMVEGFLFPIFRDQYAFYLSGFIETKKNPNDQVKAFGTSGPNGQQGAGHTGAAGYAGKQMNAVPGGFYPTVGVTTLISAEMNDRNAVKRQTRVFTIDADTGLIY